MTESELNETLKILYHTDRYLYDCLCIHLMDLDKKVERLEQENEQLGDLLDKITEHREKVLIENYEIKKKIEQKENVIKELNGCLEWHIETNERYEKSLKEIAEYGGIDMLGKTCSRVAKESLELK
jgi:predicted RNase H-like nuclease (RuvC/YqgF family)